MKVFAMSFLKKMEVEKTVPMSEWSCVPENQDFDKVYGSGANTRSQQSTYAAETDNRTDSDRPNEGMLIA